MSKYNLIISKLLYYVFTISTICNVASAGKKVQDRITPLEQRINHLEKAVSELNKAQQSINQATQNIASEQENKNNSIQNVQSKTQNIEQEIKNIQQNFTELKSKISSLENTYNTSINDINAKLNKINEIINQMDNINDNIKHYNEDIEKISETNSTLSKHVDNHSEELKQLLKEINEMKELFCNNVLDGKCSLDEFSQLVQDANKNWKKGNINDLINNLPKKNEIIVESSNDKQNVIPQNTNTITQQNGVNNNMLGSLLQQISSNNQSGNSIDGIIKIVQQQNMPGKGQMDQYSQLGQYVNQLSNTGTNNISNELLSKYLEQKKSTTPEQFQEWLANQQIADPQNYPKLLELHNKFNNMQLLNPSLDIIDNGNVTPQINTVYNNIPGISQNNLSVTVPYDTLQQQLHLPGQVTKFAQSPYNNIESGNNGNEQYSTSYISTVPNTTIVYPTNSIQDNVKINNNKNNLAQNVSEQDIPIAQKTNAEQDTIPNSVVQKDHNNNTSLPNVSDTANVNNLPVVSTNVIQNSEQIPNSGNNLPKDIGYSFVEQHTPVVQPTINVSQIPISNGTMQTPNNHNLKQNVDYGSTGQNTQIGVPINKDSGSVDNMGKIEDKDKTTQQGVSNTSVKQNTPVSAKPNTLLSTGYNSVEQQTPNNKNSENNKQQSGLEWPNNKYSVFVTDCHGNEHELSSSEAMNLIKQGEISLHYNKCSL